MTFDPTELPLPSDVPILTKPQYQQKGGGKGWKTDLATLSEGRDRLQSGQNIGFRVGLDKPTYVCFDVEMAGVLPDGAHEIVEKHALVTWTSPHGGKNRLVGVSPKAYALLHSVGTEIDLDGDGEVEIELVTDGHALAPGSKIDHSHCTSDKPCDGTGTGLYELIAANNEADPLPEEKATELLGALDHLHTSEGKAKATSDDLDFSVPEADPSALEEGELVLRTLNEKNTASFNRLVDLLKGGDGSNRWKDQNGKTKEKDRGYFDLAYKERRGPEIPDDDAPVMDRSMCEQLACTLFYESAVFLAKIDPDRAKDVTYHTVNYFVEEHPWTLDGQPRKWGRRGERYRARKIHDAANELDRGKFARFLNNTARNRWGPDGKQWGNSEGPGPVVTNAVRLACDLLVGDFPIESGEEHMDILVGEVAIGYDLDVNRNVLRAVCNAPPRARCHVSTQNSFADFGSENSQNSQDGGQIEVKSEPVEPEDYPENGEVERLAAKLIEGTGKYDHEKSYISKARQKLTQRGDCRMARVGRSYVLYPAHYPDPPNASYVHYRKEKVEPRPVEEESAGMDMGTVGD